uniref:Ig-like domain-containing protein n=1 Tax=Gopherus evgoodei TaxID=1825980 RepID=A0A8C4WQ43_9SAUR
NICWPSSFVMYIAPQIFRRKQNIFLSIPAQVWLTSGGTAQLDCRPLKIEWSVMWYKKQQSGSLQWIYESSDFATSNGKYLSKVNIMANMFSIIINNAQTNDSGVYYCGRSTSVYLQPNFGNGTRLIVTDASEPSLSILVPSTPEDAELPPVIPLLCLLSDFTSPWSAVLWDTGEEASEGQMDAGAIDGNGVFSVWSLMTIPSETWNQKMICNCTAKENSPGRSITPLKTFIFPPSVVRNGFLVKQPEPSPPCDHSKDTQGSLELSQRGIIREGNQREQRAECQE